MVWWRAPGCPGTSIRPPGGGALLYQRQATWIWRWAFPVLLIGFALATALAAVLAGVELAALLWLLAAVFAGAAIGCRRWGDWRRETVDELLRQLGERGVHPG